MPRLVPLLAAAAVLLAASCSSGGDRLPPPSSTSSTEPPPTTERPDYSTVVLAPVPGETTTTLTTTGRAALVGVVEGPDGPTAGATVRLERLVGTATQVTDVGTREDGTFEVTRIPGGRYRVRAFRVPDLLGEEPEIFFLDDGDRRELRLSTRSFNGRDVRSATAPRSPTVDDQVNVLLRVSDRSVDPDGVGRERPVPGVPVRLETSGWRALGPTAATTSERGTVVFSFRCDEPGPVSAVAFVGPEQAPVPLDVPGCSSRPTTTTTTSTTAPPDDGTTTTTSSVFPPPTFDN